MRKRILVTGGAGFLGSHLCDRLVEAGHEVVCLDNFFTSHRGNIEHLLGKTNFELVRADVTNPVQFEVDQIYNLACPAAPGHYQYNPIKTMKTSVMGAMNVLGLARRVRARVLQASTSEVYGDPAIHPQVESYWGNVNPIGPRACYDEGKRAAETLFFDYHRMNNVSIRVARIFNTYGPRIHPFDGRVVSNFIRQAVAGQDITLFGDGSQFGCKFTYAVQEKPNGLAQAFVIGEKFIGNDSVALVLGDNIFYGSALGSLLQNHTTINGGVIFAYHVSDPERYGVVEFDSEMKVLSIEEKPKEPKSNFAVPGLYFYDNSVVEIAKNIKPGVRGEYEITDVNKEYLKQGKLQVAVLDRGTAWLDTGTFDSLMQASQFVQVIENRQGLKVGCIEEIAWRKKFIDDNQLRKLAEPLLKSGYGKYLMDILE